MAKLTLTPTERMKEWRKKNPDKNRKNAARHYYKNKDKIASRIVKNKYGLSLIDYDNLVKEQNGKCAICSSIHTNGNCARFHVDHDHSNNKVRGLLCYKCNSLLGYANDDIEILINAVNYLKRDH